MFCTLGEEFEGELFSVLLEKDGRTTSRVPEGYDIRYTKGSLHDNESS